MREKLDELARLLEAAKIGTLEVEDQTVYSLENGVNDVWFGVNVKGNHANHAERRLAAAKAIAGIVNAFPDLLEYVRGFEGEREHWRELLVSLDRESLCDAHLGIGAEEYLAAWLAARDAQQRREGAAEAYENVRSLLALSSDDDLLLAVEAQRIREGR